MPYMMLSTLCFFALLSPIDDKECFEGMGFVMSMFTVTGIPLSKCSVTLKESIDGSSSLLAHYLNLNGPMYCSLIDEVKNVC